MQDAKIGLVLDRSGSMSTMWSDAIGGVNDFIKQQGEAEGNAWITLNFFDTHIDRLYYAYNAVDIPAIPVDGDIRPRGATALIDATLKTIADVEGWLSDNAWFEGKVFVVVMTDGMENSSEAAPSTLKAKVEEKEAAGWEFVYLAANVDTDATAKNFGFKLKSSLTYDDRSVGAAYAATSASVLGSRSTGERATFKNRDVREGSR